MGTRNADHPTPSDNARATQQRIPARPGEVASCRLVTQRDLGGGWVAGAARPVVP